MPEAASGQTPLAAPFFEDGERLALVRLARREPEADAGCRKSCSEPCDDDEVQAGEREAALACAT